MLRRLYIISRQKPGIEELRTVQRISATAGTGQIDGVNDTLTNVIDGVFSVTRTWVKFGHLKHRI